MGGGTWNPNPPGTWDATGYGQQAGGTHPTGMPSCLIFVAALRKLLECLLSELSFFGDKSHFLVVCIVINIAKNVSKSLSLQSFPVLNLLLSLSQVVVARLCKQGRRGIL